MGGEGFWKDTVWNGWGIGAACLSRTAQLMLLRPVNKPPVEDDGIQPIQGLIHSYGPVVGCV